MTKAAALSRREIREQKRRKKKIKQNLQYGLIAAGVLLLLISVFLNNSNNSAATVATEATYNTEDVVYDQPMHAIHEMDGSSVNTIPFLPADGPQPKIAFAEDFYSFGTIGPKDVVTYQFAIFNQGEAPLTIYRAYTTCGCTTADFTATVIPPGKVSIMTLTLDAGFHDVAGQTVRRGVIIESDDPNNPETELWTQAIVSNQ